MPLRTIAGVFVMATTLAGWCFGQGLGDAADRERRRRASSRRPAVGELVPGITRYAGTLHTLGQTHPLGLVTEIRDGGRAWIVNDIWRSGSGFTTETSELEKGSMHLLRHSSRLGPNVTELEIRDGRATGRDGHVAFGPFEASWSPLSFQVGGSLFAVAGAPQVVASLPLAQGYSIRLRHLEIGRRGAVGKTLTVRGEENVAVPAGRFLAWRVEIAADDPGSRSMTVWVGVESHKVLRVDSPSPAGASHAYSILLQP